MLLTYNYHQVANGTWNFDVTGNGEVYIRDGSTIQSVTAFKYKFEVAAGAVLVIENSTIMDCGWNDSNPGAVIHADNAFFWNATLKDNYDGVTLNGQNAIFRNGTVKDNVNIVHLSYTNRLLPI